MAVNDTLRERGLHVMIFIGLIFLAFIIRLFSIQVVNSEYKGKAQRNMVKTKIITPPRGNIYNRYGQIYVSNSPIFDLYIDPRELYIPDTSVFYSYLDMTPQEVRKEIAKSRIQESIFARYIEPATYTSLLEKTWAFRGINFSANNKRFYQHPVGGNFLGYISEVDSAGIKASDGYYRMGDIVGKSGIEREYETILRGEKGKKVVLRDNYNREVGSYSGGSMDQAALKGTDVMLGIDTRLQAYGESLMRNKKGSIVAIEPATGDILAFVSAPSYDPNMLAGRDLRKNWLRLRGDTLKPLYNRPLMAAYPPGSIFKVAIALAALNEGVISEDTYYSCGGGFMRNKGKPKCRMHVSPLKLHDAIKYSCNSYFSATYMDFLHSDKYGNNVYKSFPKWHDYMEVLGMGRKLGVDIPYEKPGLIPSVDMYDNEKRWYGKDQWKATTVISNAIGQGEILMTPLQMANLATVVSNRGYFVQPHFVRAIKDEGGQWQKKPYPITQTKIAARHYRSVVDAMAAVVETGTARRAHIPDIQVCGKTGTVQNPHGPDHAVFIGFAPKDNPKIAVAVIIENSGGGGGRWAAPVASLMIEQYIRKKIEAKAYEEKRILEADFLSGKN